MISVYVCCESSSLVGCWGSRAQWLFFCDDAGLKGASKEWMSLARATLCASDWLSGIHFVIIAVSPEIRRPSQNR